MDRFAAMGSFVRTVERGSFAAAAAGRGLSATMVGNYVRFLEDRLGASLLNPGLSHQRFCRVERPAGRDKLLHPA